MRRGDFAAAWRVSDEVLRARAGAPCWDWPRHLQYIWDGSPFAGRRVLVRCYHGLGDTIQFVRLLPRLQAAGATVILWAQPSLLDVLRGCAGIDELHPLHDGAPDFEYDVDLELMELPHALRLTLDALPATTPYVTVEGRSWIRPHTPAGDRAVGIVWRSGDWNERRSIPDELVGRLAGVPGVCLHALQWPADAIPPPLRPPAGPVAPVIEFARAIRDLDLLITVDSLAAHLGGALAVPTWTLLPTPADWRWMDGRRDSPWYPTMRLWRQHAAGAWAPVLSAVRRGLMAWSARPQRG